VPAAVEAGVDLLCFGNNLSYDPDIAPRAAEALARAVASGRIPAARIEQSHRRILALKRRARLVP
jgi:beta-N-acetylhexosaminidase